MAVGSVDRIFPLLQEVLLDSTAPRDYSKIQGPSMESNSVFRGVGQQDVPDGDDKKEQSVRDWQHYQGHM